MEIYLIRHTSVDVPAGYAYGQTDVPLKPTFEEEAEEVKKGLSDHTFDKVWTSPLTRCVRLANYCGFPEAEREDRIKEVNFGEWEMKSWNAVSYTHLTLPTILRVRSSAASDVYKRQGLVQGLG